MHKIETLFELIKSLSRTEKRYFKLHSAGSKSANYLLLFNAIDKQDVYDEQALRRKFAGKTFVKQLHVIKNYLYSQILESLRLYHSNISHQAKLHDLIREAEILFRRDLLKACEKHLQRAEKLARQFENDSQLLIILQWQRKLILRVSGAGMAKEKLNEISGNISICLKRLFQVSDYWNITINFFDIYSNAGPNEFRKKYDRDTASEPLGHHAQVLHNYIGQTLSFVENIPGEAMRATNELIEYLESRPEFISDDPTTYVTALNNKISVCLRQKKYKEIPPLLQRIRSIPETFGVDPRGVSAIKMTVHTFNVELEMYRDTNDIIAGMKLIDQIKAYLKKYQKRIPGTYQFLLYYQFASLYFLNKEYDSALEWVNRITAIPAAEVRQDIRKQAELMRLIIHYELNNITVLRYAVANCRKFLQRRNQYGNYEKELLKLFSRLCTLPFSDHLSAFQSTYDELFSTDISKEVKNELDYLNFADWIADHLKKLS
ncbi:MAG: hypothetical protein ACRBF0_14300 [Calditrichia bacterium]